VHFWLRPSDLPGFIIVDKLTADGALGTADPQAAQAQARIVSPTIVSLMFNPHQQPATQTQAAQPFGNHRMALNIVSRWSIGAGTMVVGMPLVTSILLAVVWPAVSVAVFHADVQTSVQTSFTIASYVITAGALLVALVAFLDTQNDKIQAP
jgi:hypothetical protein